MIPDDIGHQPYAGFDEAAAPPRRTIPFDYTFRFLLRGVPDARHNQTIAVSIEAAFTAVSIGYGVVPEVTTITFGPPLDEVPEPEPPILLSTSSPSGPTGNPGLRNVTLANLVDALKASVSETEADVGQVVGPRTASALLNGIRLNPRLAELAFRRNASAPLGDDEFRTLFETVAAPPERVLFLYALFDEGSGRQFQEDPLLNIAGLGSADGDRPFRRFSPPVTFAPRTHIRLEITEKSDFRGELHVSLHGYKVLGASGTPTGRSLQRRPRRRRPR